MNTQIIIKATLTQELKRASVILAQGMDRCDIHERDPEEHEVTHLRSLWRIRMALYAMLYAYRITEKTQEYTVEEMIKFARQQLDGKFSIDFWEIVQNTYWAIHTMCPLCLRPSEEEVLEEIGRRLPKIERNLRQRTRTQEKHVAASGDPLTLLRRRRRGYESRD